MRHGNHSRPRAEQALDFVEPQLATFILPLRTNDLYRQTAAELERLDVHVFLSLKWLWRLKVVDETSGNTALIENLGEASGVVTLAKDKARQRFAVFRRTAAVPPEVAADPALVFYKRGSVSQREVVVAFAVDEAGNLRPIDEASALGSVSSFLPLVEKRSGASRSPEWRTILGVRCRGDS